MRKSLFLFVILLVVSFNAQAQQCTDCATENITTVTRSMTQTKVWTPGQSITVRTVYRIQVAVLTDTPERLPVFKGMNTFAIPFHQNQVVVWKVLLDSKYYDRANAQLILNALIKEGLVCEGMIIQTLETL